jgi:hypothetical protein
MVAGGLWVLLLPSVFGAEASPAGAAAGSRFFVLQAIDQDTGRGVPLVELLTVNQIPFWTDSAGRVAFDEPGLMGRETFFHVRSPGYAFPGDGFGYHGVRLTPVPGGTATVRLQRTNIAERLYRITGQGIYRDTVMAGLPAPIREPLLNAQVTGQDTVIATPYRGRIHWFWGDTDRAGYPLGNFGATGATSPLPGPGGLDPAVGIDLTYFTGEKGFVRAMCPQPDHGLRWIEGVMTVPDATGRERLVARVAHQKDLATALGTYLMLFDDAKEQFEILEHWDSREGHDSSHPFRVRTGGREYLYLFPNWRVPADLESLRDPTRYEAYTCLAGDGLWRGAANRIERAGDGRVRYGWKPGAARLHPGRMRSLVNSGLLKDDETWLALRDPDTGERVEAGRGSVAWNAFRNRWVMVTSGKAGEIWFAEADTPTGPWIHARRVAVHGEYNFYNPVHHDFLDQEGGRVVYFEGTYTATFSGAKTRTPRYDYNQILYRLNLDDPRLRLPVPVYRLCDDRGGWVFRTREGVVAENAWNRVEAVPFFALPPLPPSRIGMTRPEPGAVAGSRCVNIAARAGEGRELLVPESPGSGDVKKIALFQALEPEPGSGGIRTNLLAALHEYRHPEGRSTYAVSDTEVPEGFQRRGPALGWVWPNPQSVLTLDPP